MEKWYDAFSHGEVLGKYTMVLKLRSVEFVMDTGRVSGVNCLIRTAVRESTLAKLMRIAEGSCLALSQVGTHPLAAE
jgi:hypothetical protein